MADRSVGPYRIIERLGAGGMGEVFLGHDPRLDRRVALKCLTSAAAGSSSGRAKIMREARAAARLTHAHIAGVYDVLQEDDRTFIVMEYVEGVSLAAHLARGPRPAAEIRAIGRQLTSALAAAHAQGVIHRDLKPANIQVMRDGSIKVLDFGVARLAPVAAQTVDTTRGRPPADDTVEGNPGTPIYMAPEQLLGQPADARSDIYSAGVILYLMATGRRPYPETNAAALALAMHGAPPPAARALNPEIPQDLSDAIERALDRDPDRRFQSAAEFETALSSPSTETVTRSYPANRTRRNLTWWSIGAAVVVFAVYVWRQPIAARLGLDRTIVARPIVLAILPVDNPTRDPRADYVGAGIASVVAQNFGAARGLTVLSRASTAAYTSKRQDLVGMQRELGIDYALDLAIRSVSPQFQLVARLRRPGIAQPDWERVISGDLRDAEQALVVGLATALQDRRVLPALSEVEANRLRRVPTTNGDALMAYSEARALIDRPDVPGNIDRAAALLERAIATDNQFALAYAALGDAFWVKYQTEKNPSVAARATEAVQHALSIDADQAPIYYSLAMMEQQTGRPDEAVVSLRRSLALQPDSDDSHRLLGRILAEIGHVDDGVAEIHQAIRIRPGFWNNHFTLGFVLYNAGRYDEALEAYRRTTELLPTHAGAFAMLGTIEYVLGHGDRAIGNYEHAVRLGPSAPAYANLAFAYFAARRYDEALTAYKQALALNPRSAVNHRNIGDVYEKLGQSENARQAFLDAIALGEESLRVNPRDAGVISLVAICEAKLGRGAAAERHAAEAVTLAPTNRDALVRSAQVHVRLNQFDAALAELASAIEHGYEPRMARQDEDLAPLRATQRFRELTTPTASLGGNRR